MHYKELDYMGSRCTGIWGWVLINNSVYHYISGFLNVVFTPFGN